jgi:murein DD-endopeptidase MepM/ murein hydrolase activator NlpD
MAGNVNRIIFLLLLCLVAGAFVSCATSYDAKGRYHKVMRGDTVASIARAYGVKAQDVAELNDIENQNQLEVGTKLYIPEKQKRGGFKKLPFGKILSDSSEKKKKSSKGSGKYARQSYEDDEGDSIRAEHGKFAWPVAGGLISPFGIRNGRRHDGVDLKGADGDPIRAAGRGKVVFAGQMRGYGNLIIIRHKEDFFTVYAHCSRNIAKKGQDVRQGDLIARVGHTGRATGPHLHFEVRRGQTARNPLFFLPHRDIDTTRGYAKR